MPVEKPTEPILIPCLLLRGGNICIPGAEGPVELDYRTGPALDLFEVVDRLAETSARIYIVDLDGIEYGAPQLDYLQELAKSAELWVDGGIRRADQTIDVIVAGARHVTLSSAFLRGPAELRRAWALSQEIIFEIEIKGDRLGGLDPSWGTHDPVALARVVREAGVTDILLSFRDADPDWNLVRAVSAGGPTWVGGTFERRDEAQLAPAGASGGIYHIREELTEWASGGDH
jgi:phosphoribosylformimino-5-aminoimidazole carboxamide ribonucleotide (ProFAR) isomerase